MRSALSYPQDSSLRTHPPKIYNFILPVALIAKGAAVRVMHTNQLYEPHNLLVDPDHTLTHFAEKRKLPRTHVDDFTQYASYVAIYAVDLMGFPARHNVRDRTFVLGSTCLIFAGTVQATKHITGVRRPDSSSKNSLPSGHTATAFAGAHIFYREYHESLGWVAASGYLVAAATGSLRIWNRRHWYSDVLIGAGVGIMAAELGYLLLPLWQNMFKVDGNKLNVSFNVGYAPEMMMAGR